MDKGTHHDSYKLKFPIPLRKFKDINNVNDDTNFLETKGVYKPKLDYLTLHSNNVNDDTNFFETKGVYKPKA